MYDTIHATLQNRPTQNFHRAAPGPAAQAVDKVSGCPLYYERSTRRRDRVRDTQFRVGSTAVTIGYLKKVWKWVD